MIVYAIYLLKFRKSLSHYLFSIIKFILKKYATLCTYIHLSCKYTNNYSQYDQ